MGKKRNEAVFSVVALWNLMDTHMNTLSQCHYVCKMHNSKVSCPSWDILLTYMRVKQKRADSSPSDCSDKSAADSNKGNEADNSFFN
ncbi:hypothetical protein GJ496_001258 [Pomphorhynchus laevis]|nr:hypothetical protein GJ496_001258 [Pomphorhynchus laevis]